MVCLYGSPRLLAHPGRCEDPNRAISAWFFQANSEAKLDGILVNYGVDVVDEAHPGSSKIFWNVERKLCKLDIIGCPKGELPTQEPHQAVER